MCVVTLILRKLPEISRLNSIAKLESNILHVLNGLMYFGMHIGIDNIWVSFALRSLDSGLDQHIKFYFHFKHVPYLPSLDQYIVSLDDE